MSAQPSHVDLLESARYRGPGVSWDDVVGLGHARREVAAVLALLRKRELARRVGAELTPLLFLGPAGVGKTMMAKAISRDLDLPLYQWASSEVNAETIAAIFNTLRTQPCVIFFDELDLIATERTSEQHSERTKSALIQLCTELDGMDVVDGPLVIAATAAHPFMLDDSLLRSGRFSTKILFTLPDHDERRHLFELYVGRLIAEEELDLEEAASRSQGATGADVRAILNAGLALALADGRHGLTRAHLFEALERRGYVLRQVTLPANELWTIAVHEAGHALAAFGLLGAEALNRVSIVPSAAPESMSDGHFALRQEWRETHPVDSISWRADALISLAGVAAEELLLGRHVFGSRDDVARVTGSLLSRIEQGAAPDISPVVPDLLEGHVGSGSSVMRDRIWSSVERLSDELYREIRHLLEPEREALERFPGVLREQQSLSGRALIAALRDSGAREAGAPASHASR